MHIIRFETLGRRLASAKSLAKSLGKTLGATFRARQVSPQSLGSDYMHDSLQNSLQDSFYYAREHTNCSYTYVRKSFSQNLRLLG